MDDDSERHPDLSTFGTGSDGDDASDSHGGDGSGGDGSDAEGDDGDGAASDGTTAGDGTTVDDGSDDAASGSDRDSVVGRDVRELDRDERIELGVELLAHLETDDLPLSAAVDRIETVTTNPTLTREILDTAELRGVIEREGGRILTRRGGTFVRFDAQVVRRTGEFTCRRCGAGLSTGHFVRFESGELGPFGSSCVEKVLGRS